MINYMFKVRIKSYILKIANGNVATFTKDLKIYYSITKDSWMYLLAILITFTATLVVFPAVTALVQPISKGRSNYECSLLAFSILLSIIHLYSKVLYYVFNDN